MEGYVVVEMVLIVSKMAGIAAVALIGLTLLAIALDRIDV